MRAEGCVALLRGLTQHHALTRSAVASEQVSEWCHTARSYSLAYRLRCLSLLVHSLDLSYHGLHSSGCVAIAEAMRRSQLRNIGLQKNHIHTKGAKAIAK